MSIVHKEPRKASYRAWPPLHISTLSCTQHWWAGQYVSNRTVYLLILRKNVPYLVKMVHNCNHNEINQLNVGILATIQSTCTVLLTLKSLKCMEHSFAWSIWVQNSVSHSKGRTWVESSRIGCWGGLQSMSINSYWWCGGSPCSDH